MARRKESIIPDAILDQRLAGADAKTAFDPARIAKYQRRFPGFGEKIISLYARGMSTREITGHLRELYGIEVTLLRIGGHLC